MTVPRIDTERLVLTWPTEAQIDGYYSAVAGTSMFDTILWDGLSSARELHEGWERRRARAADPAQTFTLAVIEKNSNRSSNRYVGEVSVGPFGSNPQILELGYAFAPAVHGRGYATEAVRALVEHAFVERDAERICAPIFIGNVASRRVAEKAGLLYEGTLRRNVSKRGVWRDEWLLAITRPDWEQRTPGLPVQEVAPR